MPTPHKVYLEIVKNCPCEFCERATNQVILFTVKDGDRTVRQVCQCIDCLQAVLLKVVSLLPIAFILDHALFDPVHCALIAM